VLFELAPQVLGKLLRHLLDRVPDLVPPLLRRLLRVVGHHSPWLCPSLTASSSCPPARVRSSNRNRSPSSNDTTWSTASLPTSIGRVPIGCPSWITRYAPSSWRKVVTRSPMRSGPAGRLAPNSSNHSSSIASVPGSWTENVSTTGLLVTEWVCSSRNISPTAISRL